MYDLEIGEKPPGTLHDVRTGPPRRCEALRRSPMRPHVRRMLVAVADVAGYGGLARDRALANSMKARVLAGGSPRPGHAT